MDKNLQNRRRLTKLTKIDRIDKYRRISKKIDSKILPIDAELSLLELPFKYPILSWSKGSSLGESLDKELLDEEAVNLLKSFKSVIFNFVGDEQVPEWPVISLDASLMGSDWIRDRSWFFLPDWGPKIKMIKLLKWPKWSKSRKWCK